MEGPIKRARFEFTCATDEVLYNTNLLLAHIGPYLSLVDRSNFSRINKRVYDAFTRVDPGLRTMRTEYDPWRRDAILKSYVPECMYHVFRREQHLATKATKRNYITRTAESGNKDLLLFFKSVLIHSNANEDLANLFSLMISILAQFKHESLLLEIFQNENNVWNATKYGDATLRRFYAYSIVNELRTMELTVEPLLKGGSKNFIAYRRLKVCITYSCECANAEQVFQHAWSTMDKSEQDYSRDMLYTYLHCDVAFHRYIFNYIKP